LIGYDHLFICLTLPSHQASLKLAAVAYFIQRLSLFSIKLVRSIPKSFQFHLVAFIFHLIMRHLSRLTQCYHFLQTFILQANLVLKEWVSFYFSTCLFANRFTFLVN